MRWHELFSCLQSLPHAFWQTSFLVATWHVFNNGFSLPLFNKTVTGEAPAQQLLYLVPPISVAEAWKSVKVDTGLLVASSTSCYLALGFWGWPALGRFKTGPQSTALCISHFFLCCLESSFSSWLNTDTQYWLIRS